MEKHSVKEKIKKRIRGSKFTEEENLLLINLIDKYKQIVLNKSTNKDANLAKEAAWVKIAKQYNQSSIVQYKRTNQHLKQRWHNLSKTVKKKSENLLDSDYVQLHEADMMAMTLISAADGISNTEITQDIIEEDTNSIDVDDDGSDQPKDVLDSDKSESDDGDENARRTRGKMFSPQESILLVECVKKEKQHVFSKTNSTRALTAKKEAWLRIANSFNELSPCKRSAKCLKQKFNNIKKVARLYGRDVLHNKQHEELANDSFESIKQEPSTEEKNGTLEDVFDQFSDKDDHDLNDDLDRAEKSEAVPPDPLSAVLNSDSGIGSTSSQMTSWNWHYSDNKDIIKLQKELLNYQMETAKLERKRLEEAMAEEAREREARATERTLRLRAARLDAVVAASRLPPSHPAVQFTPEEARAMQHFNQYQET